MYNFLLNFSCQRNSKLRYSFMYLLCSLSLLLLWNHSSHAQNWAATMRVIHEQLDDSTLKGAKAVETEYADQLRSAWQKQSLSVEAIPKRRPKPENPSQKKDLSYARMELQKQTALIAENTPETFQTQGMSMQSVSRVKVAEPQWNTKAYRTLGAVSSYSFFGQSISFRFPPQLAFKLGYRCSKQDISRAWKKLSYYNAERTLMPLMSKARTLGLNDWGFFLLVNKTAQLIYPDDENAQTLFNLYQLTHAGYKCRLSYDGRKLYLMTPTRQRIYGGTFLKDGDKKYYLLDLNGKEVNVSSAHTLNLDYPRASKVLDFSLNNAPNFQGPILKRRLKFVYENKPYALTVNVNKNLVAFYRTYPFVDWNIQLGAPPSRELQRTLIPAVKNMVKGKSDWEAANIILRLVQTGLDYKTDTEQFGSENYLFIDETLYYPYADCEDRSVLYTYLIKEVLGLQTIGLIFPNHAATAIQFRQKVPGTYITYRSRRFTVCDPTYMYASCGRILPEVRGKRAKIFVP